MYLVMQELWLLVSFVTTTLSLPFTIKVVNFVVCCYILKFSKQCRPRSDCSTLSLDQSPYCLHACKNATVVKMKKFQQTTSADNILAKNFGLQLACQKSAS